MLQRYNVMSLQRYVIITLCRYVVGWLVGWLVGKRYSTGSLYSLCIVYTKCAGGGFRGE